MKIKECELKHNSLLHRSQVDYGKIMNDELYNNK